MGLLDIFKKDIRKKATFQSTNMEKGDWGSPYDTVEQLGLRGYQLKYFDVCKNLWKTKVPRSGQADTVQGEMLRQAEKLRNEARDNGNLNLKSPKS